MHDVLDPRDLVPDEAEELLLSGYPAGALLEEARAAAVAGDLAELQRIESRLAHLSRDAGWPFEEPTSEAELRRLADRASRRAVDPSELASRIRGAWLGRVVGNTMGKPIEGLTRAEVAAYLDAAGLRRLDGYLPLLSPLPDGVSHLHPSAPSATAGAFTEMPRDDDVDWTILALAVLERHGRDFSTEQLAAAWLDRIPFTQTYTAERAAYRNLIAGLRPPQTATVRNPYREWIGALIRVDAYGYVSPGDPAGAAALALRDARLSHVGNGIAGAMWAAALVAAAFGATTAREAIDAALEVVPPRSRLAAAVQGVVDIADSGEPHTAALDWIDAELGAYSWVHTLPNAAQITAALLWGDDLLGALSIALEGGRDTDSNGATVGSVVGALGGEAAIPARLLPSEPLRVRSAVRDFDRITIDELAERTLRLVQEG